MIILKYVNLSFLKNNNNFENNIKIPIMIILFTSSKWLTVINTIFVKYEYNKMVFFRIMK